MTLTLFAFGHPDFSQLGAKPKTSKRGKWKKPVGSKRKVKKTLIKSRTTPHE